MSDHFVSAAICPAGLFGGYSAAMMRADGTGRQSKTFPTVDECRDAIEKRYPGIPITEDF